MPTMFRLLATVTLSPALLLVACNSSDETVLADGASPSALPVLTTDPMPLLGTNQVSLEAAGGSPLTAGGWQISENSTRGTASFVSPEGKGLLTISCDIDTKVLSLAVANVAPGNQTFVLQSGGTAARLDTIADNNSVDPHQIAAIAPQTPVFEGFVHPDSTIEVFQPGGMPLRLPANGGIRSVFEACR